MASLYAALEAMKLLFSDGRINVDSQNKYGETALHLAAGSGDKGAAKAAQMLLTSGGASLTVKDKWGRGPVDVSYDNAEVRRRARLERSDSKALYRRPTFF